MFIVSAVFNQWVTSANPVWGKFVLREPTMTRVPFTLRHNSWRRSSQFMTMCDGPFVMMCETVTDQFSVHFIIAPGSIDGRPNVANRPRSVCLLGPSRIRTTGQITSLVSSLFSQNPPLFHFQCGCRGYQGLIIDLVVIVVVGMTNGTDNAANRPGLGPN